MWNLIILSAPGSAEGGGLGREREGERECERERMSLAGGWIQEEGGVKIAKCWASGFCTEQLAGISTGRAAQRTDTWKTPLLRSPWDAEVDFQEVFMGCTIYAASPKALPADEAPGQDRYYQLPHCRPPHGNCSQRIAASRARSVSSSRRCRVCGVWVTSYTEQVEAEDPDEWGV